MANELNCIQSKIDRSFVDYKNNIAVEHGKDRITYNELKLKSDFFVRYFRENEISVQQHIGILLSSKIDAIACILAILKCKCIFVPIDIKLSGERIMSQLTSVSCEHVFVDADNEGLNEYIQQKKLNVHLHKIEEVYTSDFDLNKNYYEDACTYENDDAIYIYFTSGTEGKPKGIIGRNIGLSHFIDWEIDTLKVDCGTRISQITSIGFDAFLRDIFVALCSGGTICIPPNQETILDPETFRNWIEESRINIIHCVPSVFRILNSSDIKPTDFCSLIYIMMAGETIVPNELNKWFEVFGHRIQLINLYGATEVTMAKTFYFLKPSDVKKRRISVGKAMIGSKIIILNKELRKCGPMEIGHIYIQTRFMTLGYYGDDELNNSKFITNPFTDDPKDLLYKTGDRGRFLVNGDLEFLGRIDRQVKIRGNRVELGEIENYGYTYPQIQGCVVNEKEEEEGINLCLYVVSNQKIELGIFREFISIGLPAYMVPKYIMQIVKIPLTINGKVDYDLLPEPELYVEDIVLPRDETEKQLAQIWSQILSLDIHKIGVKEKFTSLGGNSLNIMTLISKIKREFEVNITLSEVLKENTIAAISACIKSSKKEAFVSIKSCEKKEYYPLSSAQKRMYYLQQMEPASTAYNMSFFCALDKAIPQKEIKNIFGALIRQHEGLRTSFMVIDGIPVQRILDHVAIEVTEIHASQKDKLQVLNEFIRPFDLSEAPLLRVGLLEIDGAEKILLLDMHHIISDATSQKILIHDFKALLSDNQLLQLNIHYRDYSEWQQNKSYQKALVSKKAYWLNELKGDLPNLSLSEDYVRPHEFNFEGEGIQFKLDREVTRGIKELSDKMVVTPFMLLLSGLYILLSKLSKQEDLIIGVPVEGRQYSDLEKIVGVFVGFLPIRNYPGSTIAFSTFLQEVKEKVIKSFENQAYPFEDIVESLNIKRDTSRNPIYDVVFNYITQLEVNNNSSNQSVEEKLIQTNTPAKVDILLTGIESKDEIILELIYYRSLYKRSTVQKFIIYFQHIINELIKHPDKKIGEIKLEPLDEHIDTKLRRDCKVLLKNNCIQKALQASFLAHEQNIAIEYSNYKLSYRELDLRSDCIAHKIIELKLEQGSFVGLLVQDRKEFITTMIGVLKARCVFVPIDTLLPTERIEGLLAQLPIRLLIRDNDEATVKLAETINNFEIGDDFYLTGKSQSIVTKRSDYSPEDAIYVYFTSGTTGVPNAILGRNESLCHFIEWEKAKFKLEPGIRVSQLISPGFDGSLRDIFTTLVSGGTICIPSDREKTLDSEMLKNWVEDSRVNLIHCVPSVFRILSSGNIGPSDFKNLKYIVLAGEDIIPGELRKWYKMIGSRVQLVNLYGATEVTMAKSSYNIQVQDVDRKKIPVGYAIEGSQLVVLDENLEPCETLVRGEIFIRTPYDTFGYYNNATLTNERFIQNPFTKDPKDLLYKTGDWGRFLVNGELEFLGRMDRQIKVRGNRLEIGEVENYVYKYPQIQCCVVNVLKEENGINLSLYLVSNQKIELDKFREFMSNGLPGYMVPKYIMQIEKIPLTINGKVAYDLLPEPEIYVQQIVLPENEIQKRLAKIWSEILSLDIERIGVKEKFTSLGGNSLNIMMLISKIKREFEVNITLSEILKDNTIEAISECIKKSQKEVYISIRHAEKKEYYPLSSAQKRMYFMQQMEPLNTAYHLSFWVYYENFTDAATLERAIKEVIKRHQGLRTSFISINDVPYQKIHDEVSFQIKFYTDELKFAGNELVPVPYDLFIAPLFKVSILEKENGLYLFFESHHIINDGISQEIIKNEINSFIKGELLPEVNVQYKDYSEWQNSKAFKQNAKKEESYWKKKFTGHLPILDLPFDNKKGNNSKSEGKCAVFLLKKEETLQIKALTKQYNVTPFAFLLSTFYTLLYKITGQTEIILGIPISGRSYHPDLTGPVGMFVNTMPQRIYFKDDSSFEEFLNIVQTELYDMIKHQDYQFDDLINLLRESGNPNLPSFNVVFNYISFFSKGFENFDDHNADQHTRGNGQFDITLYAIERDNYIHFHFDYNHNLFNEETIDRYIDYYQRLISQFLQAPTIQISKVKILEDSEKESLFMITPLER